MEPTAPHLKFFADANILVDKPQVVGEGPRGLRRVINILGGEFKGTDWQARVTGGADYQLIVSETFTELDARYTLELDGGELVYVRNRAIRSGPPELMAKIARGEPVDPAAIYFRCSPTFETASNAMRWINERMFVGTGARHPDRVALRFFEVT